MHWKVKTLQSLPLFLSHNRSRKWVSFPPFICVAFPGETVATPPYLCYCRVLQWIMKWIMQMSHNIFILTKVEVHVPVPGIYEYAHILKMAGMCYNLMEMNSNDCYTVLIIVLCFASFLICWIRSNFKIKRYSIQFSPLLQLSALLILCRIDGYCWTLIQMLSNLQFFFFLSHKNCWDHVTNGCLSVLESFRWFFVCAKCKTWTVWRLISSRGSSLSA